VPDLPRRESGALVSQMKSFFFNPLLRGPV
jgi:hypothetical protein